MHNIRYTCAGHVKNFMMAAMLKVSCYEYKQNIIFVSKTIKKMSIINNKQVDK